MAVRNKTPFMPNEIYFITFTILGWKHVFTSDKYCDLVYKWFNYMKDKYDNKIYGYVIMPNHVHLFLYVSGKSPKLPSLIFSAKKFLAFGIRDLLENRQNPLRRDSAATRMGDSAATDSITEYDKIDLLIFFAENKTKANANYKIFEPRYDSLIIQSEKFFLGKLNYIHNNPCQEKWSLAENPEDYVYSSASNYILGKGRYNIEVMGF